MELPFTKMHGAGNDYVYVNGFNVDVPNPKDVAVVVSDRHFGVGGDGLVLILPSNVADARMRMFNADGSEAEMCGNALRCVAKYVYEKGIARKETLAIETGRGILTVTLTVEGERVTAVTVDMDAPILAGRDIPTTFDDSLVVAKEVVVNGSAYTFTAVSMGNPHAVIYVDDVHAFPVEEVGRVIECHEFFPKKTNVEFVQIVSEGEVIQRTWERGSGETLACGTGASAVCVAGVLTGKTTSPLVIHLLGGDLRIAWEGEGKSVIMTGGATEVFSGTITV